MSVVGLTRKPLLYQRVNVVRNEGHRWEIPSLWLTDNLDATALLFLPVQVWWLHTAGDNGGKYLIRYACVKEVNRLIYILDELSLFYNFMSWEESALTNK